MASITAKGSHMSNVTIVGSTDWLHFKPSPVLHILELTLRKGETVFTPRGVPHAYFNQSDQVVSAAGIFTPAGFLDFMRGFEELMSGEAPSPEAFQELGTRTGVRMMGPPLSAQHS